MQQVSSNTVDKRPTSGAPGATKIATIVVADDRPVVRLGLHAAAAGAEGCEVKAAASIGKVVEAVVAQRPRLLLIAVRENDPDPFRAVAAARSLHPAMKVLAIVDAASVVDLREAVVAGVDSVLLSSSNIEEIRRACTATAGGERVVSPEVAMQLAGSWRPEQERGESTSLTARELQVLQLLAEGMTNQQIAERLTVSPRTIKTHVQNLLSKLATPDRTGAVARGFRLGLIR